MSILASKSGITSHYYSRMKIPVTIDHFDKSDTLTLTFIDGGKTQRQTRFWVKAEPDSFSALAIAMVKTNPDKAVEAFSDALKKLPKMA